MAEAVDLLVVTGEFPPRPGGVSDYAARWLVEVPRPGERPGVVTRSGVASCPGVVRTVPSFRLARVLALVPWVVRARPRTVLLHYVPYLYQRHGVPVGVCLGMLLLRARGVRVVTLLHEMWRDDDGLAATVVHHLQVVMVGWLVRASDRVVVTVEARAEELVRTFPSASGRVVLIPVSPTLPGAAGPGPEAEPGVVRLLHFGSDHPSKQVDLVRAALDELDRRGVAYSARAAGTSDTRDPRFTPLGYCTPDALAREVAAADVVLLPFADGASGRRTTLANCMSAGRPVVSTAGPSTDREWFDGALVLAGPGPAAYARAVADLCQDAPRRERLGASARRWAARTVDWPVVAPMWHDVLDGTT